MDHQSIMTALGVIGFVLALLGWAYQMGFLSARIVRNEKDIMELRAKSDQSEKDLRLQLSESFSKVYEKLDALPCHNPGWGKGERC